ncbi:MAG: DUF2807 domain-containing protein [Bacteroidales bacterium]|nr:DUF2807 domain-containing protein [Bacteroidales bacterium]
MKLAKRILFASLLAATALSVSSCYVKLSEEAKKAINIRIASSRKIYSESDSLVVFPGEFRGICNNGPVDVDFIVREGDPEVVIKGTHATRDSVKVLVDKGNGLLTIMMSGPIAQDEHVTVYAPTIKVIEARGSGDLMIHEGLSDEYLLVNKSGSGDTMIVGCETIGMVSVDKEGSGDLTIQIVNSGSVSISCSGSGDTVLKGKTGELTLKKDGSGSFYSGDLDAERVIVQRVSGSGEVAYREGGEVKSATN